VKHSYHNVPFYHRKFKSARIRPDDITSLHDLAKIPTTSKFEIQESIPADRVATGINVDSLVRRTTSGSTGIPFSVFADSRIQSYYSAIMLRAMFEDGLRIRDAMAVIADPRGFPKSRSVFQRLGITRYRYVSIFESVERQMALLRDFEPDVVKGYASSLSILAQEFGETLREVGLRLVFSSAELLDAASRRLIGSAFGGELFDLYACSEFGLLAWECKKHNGYHLNADSVLMEFLDNKGDAVGIDERGKVVCTGLLNYVMPLIRYELDDVGVPIDDECACGISLPLVKIVEGRADDFLVTTDGRVISPTVFFPYPFEDMAWVKQFRVVQQNRNSLFIQVVARQLLPNQSLVIENAEKRIKSLFGEDMQVKFQFVDKIPRDSSGKIRKIISYANG
jgi:phenylacetate-CoA ligase